MESYYYFLEHLRWNLFFNNPNDTALFLATCIPFIWIREIKFKQNKFSTLLSVYLLFLELVLLFILAKTGSRGGWVALMGGMVWFLMLSVGCKRLTWNRTVHMILTMTVLILCIQVSGFAGRADLEFVVGDKSIGNRFNVWVGALKMIATYPISGWGWGNSGRDFLNTFQKIEHTENYSTMVNTFLTYAVEAGLIVFFVTFFFIVYAILCPIRSRKNQRGRFSAIQPVASTSLMVFSIGLCFSTFFREPIIWIVPVSSVLVLMITSIADFGNSRIVRILIGSIGVSLTVTVCLFLTGNRLLQHEEISAYKIENGYEFRKNGTHDLNDFEVIIDTSIAGTKPGKVARDLLSHLQSADSFLLLKDSTSSKKSRGPTLFIGTSIPNHFCEPYILVHPTGFSEIDSESKPDLIIIPEIDNLGFKDHWIQQSNKHEVPCFTTNNCGYDPRWGVESIAQIIDNYLRNSSHLNPNDP